MPVEHVGTDDRDLLTIRAPDVAGSTIDGRGGEDVLELAGHWQAFDFTAASALMNVERIRLIGSSPAIRFSAEQVNAIQRFETPNGNVFKLEIDGSTVDLRNKIFEGPIAIRLLTDGATMITGDKQLALALDGHSVSGELLILDEVVLTDAERRALHERGIDRVRDATGVSSEDLSAPSVTGIGGSFVVSKDVLFKPFKDGVISEDIGLSSMLISMSQSRYGPETIRIEESASVRIERRDFGECDVYIADVKIGYYYQVGSSNRLDLFFTVDATAAHAEHILRSIVYQYTDGGMPAGSSVLSVSLTDLTGKTSAASIRANYTNDAPTDIDLSTYVYENTPIGTIVSYLQGVDPNYDDKLTFALENDAGGLFRLEKSEWDDWVLVLTRNLDYEAARSYSITVRATDLAGASLVKTFTIAVEDVWEWEVDGWEEGVPDEWDEGSIIWGTSGADRLRGSDYGNDKLLGLSGNDRIFGEGGFDALYGGLGRDTLNGGGGGDAFVFDTKVASKRNRNIDKITDFTANHDEIWLARSIFTKISKEGSLSKSAFWVGTRAHDSTDRVIYNKTSGALLYDPDGSGRKAAIKFAELSPKLRLSHDDFFIV